MSPFSLDGAVALVTGAGSGIGRATAIAFAEGGARGIILVARTMAKLQKTAAEIVRLHPSVITALVAADVTTVDGRAAIVAEAQTHGGLDILVNNAGLFEAAAVAETSDALWQRAYDANVTAPFALIRDLLPLLAVSRRKAVINVSSTLAEKPIPNASAYNSSKAALCQLTRSLALELAQAGIRVNCILPAIVETPMYRGRYATDSAFTQGMIDAGKLHPLGRVGQPRDIALATVFLASDAASWITGIELPVDGGMLVT